jgi:hypothetical protein
MCQGNRQLPDRQAAVTGRDEAVAAYAPPQALDGFAGPHSQQGIQEATSAEDHIRLRVQGHHGRRPAGQGVVEASGAHGREHTGTDIVQQSAAQRTPVAAE